MGSRLPSYSRRIMGLPPQGGRSVVRLDPEETSSGWKTAPGTADAVPPSACGSYLSHRPEDKTYTDWEL